MNKIVKKFILMILAMKLLNEEDDSHAYNDSDEENSDEEN